MTKDLQNVPGLERAVQTGRVGDLLKGIAEDSPEVLTGVLGQAVSTLYGAAAGAIAVSGIKVIHSALKGSGLRQIAIEFKKLKDQGKIKEDFLDTDLGRACLSDLLGAIEQNPDPRRIQALKAAFLRIAVNPGNEAEAIYQQQLLQAIGGLTSGEIILLATMLRVGGTNTHNRADAWLNDMAGKTGFLAEGIVELAEESLIKKKLIMPRAEDNILIRWGQCNRLTSFGERVCRFMQELPES
jgi:hypothetical protein